MPKSRTASRQGAPAIPAEFDHDAMIWAAWLYYEEDLTQEAVAREIGISRASVNALLRSARQQGVVRIAIDNRYLQSVGEARRIRDRFGIETCLVVPAGAPGRVPAGAPGHVPAGAPGHDPAGAPGGEADSDREAGAGFARLGQAGARLLAERLQPDDILGVSWGRTVLAVSQALPPTILPGVSVVQVTGSAIGTYRFSAELCASNIANRIGARCVHLHAPGIVSHPDVKRMLMAEPSLVQQFALISACDHLVFGVGSVATSSTAFETGFLTEDEARPYIARGAVAVLAGRFVDRAGNAVTGALDDRMIGMTIDEIRAVPDRICVAGGPDKVAPLRALLAGGFITSLVTDRPTATALLAETDATRS